MCDSEDEWTKLSELAEADERAQATRRRHPDGSTVMATLNLRELARKTEEAAIILEGAGYQTLPIELMKISGRLIEIREALERPGLGG
jgi:hypothetical protein